MKKNTTDGSIILYDLILPLIFFEIWYVLLGFVVVVLIETYIISLFLKEKFKKLILKVTQINLLTTICGYIAQGIGRVILLCVSASVFEKLLGNSFYENPILQGLFGNVGINYYEYKKGLPCEVLVNFVTSFIIVFFLSTYIESKMLKKVIEDEQKKNKVFVAVFVANLASYIVLFGWIVWNYLRIQK